MKDEIKEILEFAKSKGYIDLDYIESKLLLDYITNLQKENKKLSKEIKKNKKEDDEIRNKNCFLVNGFHELEERIDKAIEYIKQYKELDFSDLDLLNILQGENNDRRNME